MNFNKVVIPFLALLAMLSAAPLADDTQQQLRKIAADIQRLQKTIRSTSKEVETLNDELRERETRAAMLQKEIGAVNLSIGQLNRKLTTLTQERQQLTAAKKQQNAAIIAEINTSYRLGQEQTLKLILNQEDPEKVARALKYHDYFLKARSARLKAYLETLRSLEKVATAIEDNKQQLAEQRTQLAQQRQTLLAQQRQRQQLLVKLQQSMSSDEQRLNQLQVERKRLEAVIRELSEAIAAINLPSSLQPFSKQKGKMAWPTQGKLKQRFGSRRNTRINWDGWLIAAPEGASVKAIHHGRVVFADYLRGQGMLIILDHGDGYMSLYAHNQVLLKDTGDWVQQGEAIAKVGNTGGRQQAELYFEIRHNGRPTNPGNWLRST